MSSSYGITPTGFYAKPLGTVELETDTGLRNIIGASAGTDSSGRIPYASMAGQLKVLLVDGFSGMWDLLQAVVAQLDPNQAGGTAQDVIAALTGTVRNKARQSIATGLLIGDPGTQLPAGRAATVAGTTVRFSMPTGTVIATGTSWTPSATYGIGDVRYNNARTYVSLSNGTVGPSGPSGVGPYFADNGVTWRYLGDGIGNVLAGFLSDLQGPIGVATGSLNAIATPVDGWKAITNLQAGVQGAYAETDSSLRVRRDAEIATTGNTTRDAIRSNVLSVNQGSNDPNHQPPTVVQVFSNTTDFVDANGLPGHSVEVLAFGGTTADIAQAIWNCVGAGTNTFGNRSDVVLDSEGQPQTVYWSRPNTIPFWVTAAGGYDATQWPANSQAVVAQSMLSALLTGTQSWPIGRDVRYSPLNAIIMTGPAGTTGGVAVVPAPATAPPVPGLYEVISLAFGTATGPVSSATVPLGVRDVPAFDVSRCSFTATPETN